MEGTRKVDSAEEKARRGRSPVQEDTEDGHVGEAPTEVQTAPDVTARTRGRDTIAETV